MGAGGFAQPPKSQADRQAFARNPALGTAALGLPAVGRAPGGGDFRTEEVRTPRGTNRPSPRSNRPAPVSLLGNQPASNARSTGRSLIKDPVGQGSLLS